MASRRDWLDAGLAILERDGAPAVTIERLTGRLKLTKGSFYHHFKGMGGFKTALLEHFEAEHTIRFIEAVEQEPGLPGLTKLERLLDLVVADDSEPGLEISMRAWALQDDEVRAMQERVDRTRVEYLSSLWRAHGHDAEGAARLGRLTYLIVIGAEQIIPPLPVADLRSVGELALRLGAGVAEFPEQSTQEA